MSFLIWNSNTSSTMMVGRSDTPIFFLGWYCVMHRKSSVTRIANLTSFLQIFSSFITLWYYFIALQFISCCQVPHKTYSRFSDYLFRFYFSSIGYSVSKVWNYGHFWGGSAPHNDYILRRFGKTCCLQLHDDWIVSSFNNPVIILNDEAAASSECQNN